MWKGFLVAVIPLACTTWFYYFIHRPGHFRLDEILWVIAAYAIANFFTVLVVKALPNSEVLCYMCFRYIPKEDSQKKLRHGREVYACKNEIACYRLWRRENRWGKSTLEEIRKG